MGVRVRAPVRVAVAVAVEAFSFPRSLPHSLSMSLPPLLSLSTLATLRPQASVLHRTEDGHDEVEADAEAAGGWVGERCMCVL